MKDPTHVLQALHEMPPVGPKQTQTPFIRRTEKVTSWLIWSATALFIVLCILAAWHKWLSPLVGIWRSIALLSGIGAMILPFLSMTAQIISALAIIFRFNRDSLDSLLLTIQHDGDYVNQLMAFDAETLESAQTWLQLQATRIKNRINILFGNPERTAFFSLAGMGWAVWKEFSAQQGTTISKQVIAGWEGMHDVFIYGTCLLAGLALGAVFMNFRLQRYSYQLELLALTISQKSKALKGP